MTGAGGTLDGGTDVRPPPASLFPTLADGAPGWHFTFDTTTQDAGFSQVVKNGQVCATMQEYGTYTLGWPDSTTGRDLAAGTYQLTLEVWATVAPMNFEAKVANTTTGRTDFDVMSDAVGTSPQTFTHTFTLTAEEPSAGIAFNVGNYPVPAVLNQPGPTSTICFTDVALSAFADP
jgi:hypothetical protein